MKPRELCARDCATAGCASRLLRYSTPTRFTRPRAMVPSFWPSDALVKVHSLSKAYCCFAPGTYLCKSTMLHLRILLCNPERKDLTSYKDDS